MKKFMMVVVLGVSSQALASGNLNDAFANALKAADQDHQNQQVILKVSPDQIEKSTFKRDNSVHIVKVEDNMLTDATKSGLAPKAPFTELGSDDVAHLKQEIGEMQN